MQNKERSQFLEVADKFKSLFRPQLQLVNEKIRGEIAQVLRRPAVSEEVAAVMIQQQ